MTVQSINIQRATGDLYIPSCYFDEKPSGTPVLGDKKLITNLEKTINAFEGHLRTNRLFIKPKALKLVVKESADLAVSASEVIMNFEQASDFKLFRKSLLKSWFLTFASQKIKDDKFTQEVVSDIFQYVFWNELNWNRETNFKRWLKYVYSEKDICKTNYIPHEREAFCNLVSEAEDTTDFDQISMWSLRPLVVNRILYYYDQMTYAQKLEFSKYWMRLVVTFKGDLPSHSLNFKSFSQVYNAYMDQFVGPLLNVQFEESLGIDYVFEFETPQPYSLVDYKNELPFLMSKNILFKFKNNTFINLRNGSKIVSTQANARHWVLVQKKLPELRQVKKFPAEYLTIIQAKKEYDLNRFYKKIDDISEFPWRDEFDSLTIYVPSLKLLGQLAPEMRLEEDLKSFSRNKQVTKVLGWSPVQ